MSRDKQIEEMASIINLPCSGHCEECPYLDCGCLEKLRAVSLYNAGYRKASDLAEEIFAEIEKIIDKHYNRHIFGVEDLSDVEQEAVMNFSGDVTYDIAELKKKYTEDKNDEM